MQALSIAYQNIWWIIACVNLERENLIAPRKRSAAVLAILWSEDIGKAQKQLLRWAKENGGEVACILDSGSFADDFPVHDGETDFTQLFRTVAATHEPVFQVLIASNKPVDTCKRISFIENYKDAMLFLREHRLPIHPLSAQQTEEIRSEWRRLYLPRNLSSKQRHRCGGCSKGQVCVYEWDALQCPDEAPPLADLLTRDEPIVLFFERCDLPAFVCASPLLREFEPMDFVDLYLTPLKDLRWTVVYTHEAEFGPYFCKRRL